MKRIRKTKTDAVDSELIARTILAGDARATLVPDEAMFEMRLLVRHRWRMIRLNGNVLRYAIGLVDRVFPEYEGVFCKPFLPSVRTLIREVGLTPNVLVAKKDEVAKVLKKASRGRFSTETIADLLKRASDSIGTRQGNEVINAQFRLIADYLDFTEGQIVSINETMPTPINPKQIRIDFDTQSRVGLNEEIVKEYADAMEAGEEFPAVRAFFDDTIIAYVLSDGFHRYAAHMRVRPNEPILVDVRLGTVADARWESIGANKSHGLRRSNEDKRHVVKRALLHPNGAEMSNVKIAEHVGVSEFLVRTIRVELESTSILSKSSIRIGQDGRTINTERIGKTDIPPGSTCANCRHFEKGRCQTHETEPASETAACDEWEIRVETVPNRPMPPPDYDNLTVYDGCNKGAKSSNPNQYRRLKGCVNVSLPPDNPQLFAIELRNYFAPEYLVACFAALKHLLLEPDD